MRVVSYITPPWRVCGTWFTFQKDGNKGFGQGWWIFINAALGLWKHLNRLTMSKSKTTLILRAAATIFSRQNQIFLKIILYIFSIVEFPKVKIPKYFVIVFCQSLIFPQRSWSEHGSFKGHQMDRWIENWQTYWWMHLYIKGCTDRQTDKEINGYTWTRTDNLKGQWTNTADGSMCACMNGCYAPGWTDEWMEWFRQKNRNKVRKNKPFFIIHFVFVHLSIFKLKSL